MNHQHHTAGTAAYLDVYCIWLLQNQLLNQFDGLLGCILEGPCGMLLLWRF